MSELSWDHLSSRFRSQATSQQDFGGRIASNE